MALATVVEKYGGSSYVHTYIYGAWWFTLLWAVLSAIGIFWFIKSKVKRVYAVTLHSALVIILIGAGLTHFTSKQGILHLRVGKTETYYEVRRISERKVVKRKLHFAITLKRFDVVYHDGTTTAADYQSTIIVKDGDAERECIVAMNKIFSFKSVRLYQMSYDDDMKGSTLTVNSDPWGIPVTYTGYALLFISLMWMLIDPRGSFRRLLRSPLLKKGMLLTAALLVSGVLQAGVPPALPRDIADELGRLNMLYCGRICPVQTFALDFTKKIYGSRTYKGLTPEQIISGWLLFSDEWADEPFIRIKEGELRKKLKADSHASLSSFFRKDKRANYLLGPMIKEYYSGNRSKLMKQAADVDQRLQLVMDLRAGSPMKIFPQKFLQSHSRTHTEQAVAAGTTLWYAPGDATHSSMDAEERMFIKKVLPLIKEMARNGDHEGIREIIRKIALYQQNNASEALPTSFQTRCERANNAVPYTTILFMVNLTFGLLALGYTIYRHIHAGSEWVWLRTTLLTVMAASLLALTYLLALRWIISGNVPMSNGYETMLLVAWFVEIITLLMYRRVRILLVFGLLLSGFFLLVSHINQMDPAIGKMMPVLDSPLLSVHVSFMMMSYALCSLTFICGVTGLCVRSRAKEMQVLSQVFLYPSVTMMGLGIFIGAIWANQSWGVYWSWDPKETWALITLLVYAVPLHGVTVPVLRKPLPYHLYMTIAFLSILMTYFGVNYVLGGMHSYA